MRAATAARRGSPSGNAASSIDSASNQRSAPAAGHARCRNEKRAAPLAGPLQPPCTICFPLCFSLKLRSRSSPGKFTGRSTQSGSIVTIDVILRPNRFKGYPNWTIPVKYTYVEEIASDMYSLN
jgi:hypothetical protein